MAAGRRPSDARPSPVPLPAGVRAALKETAIKHRSRHGWEKAKSRLRPAFGPVIVPAQVISAVKPVVPAHFLGARLHRDQMEVAFWALFTVHADGIATVAMTESTGHAALDALALNAARRWRFAPATQNGAPVESYLRLKIEFEATPTGNPPRIRRKQDR